MTQGTLFIVCGPSGVGKTSLGRRLRMERPNLTLSVSHTTRAPRQGEVDGVDYTFLDIDAFVAQKERGMYAEWALVHGNYYGTPCSAIEAAWAQGQDLLFDIDYQGARQLQQSFKTETVSVLIIPPDMDALEVRLRSRATDAQKVISSRLEAARGELAQFAIYDFIIENDDFDHAYEALRSVYDASAHRATLHVQRMRQMLSHSH